MEGSGLHEKGLNRLVGIKLGMGWIGSLGETYDYPISGANMGAILFPKRADRTIMG